MIATVSDINLFSNFYDFIFDLLLAMKELYFAEYLHYQLFVLILRFRFECW
jgi:hypothetical protein